MILDILIGLAFAFVGTVGCGIMFNAPKSELLPGGINGAIGWLVYRLTVDLVGATPVFATLFAAIAITFVAKILTVQRRMPLSVFLTPGIIMLAPGYYIYNTMYHLTIDEAYVAVGYGVETFKIAGGIAVGILIVFTLFPVKTKPTPLKNISK